MPIPNNIQEIKVSKNKNYEENYHYNTRDGTAGFRSYGLRMQFYNSFDGRSKIR